VPYLAYARKDRRTAPYDSVSSRYLAQLFEAVGTDMLLTLEVHNPAAFDNAFRCRTIRLDSSLLFEDAAVALDDGGRLVVVSPDPGGIKRARSWREALEKRIGRSVGQAFVDKSRRAGVVAGSPIVVGDVADATLLVFDDMISTGTTMARATCALKDAGARRIFAFTAHGLFVAEAPTLLSSAPIDRMFVSDTILPLHLPSNGIGWRTEVISAAPLFATAIRQQSTTGM
jgi:ribose-phosphate pyrophosphokinase